MNKIGDWAEAFDFGCDYLKENGGSQTEFLLACQDKERLGQAFFNALSDTDQEKIRGLGLDPFYRTEPQAIWDAIAFLMDH